MNIKNLIPFIFLFLTGISFADNPVLSDPAHGTVTVGNRLGKISSIYVPEDAVDRMIAYYQTQTVGGGVFAYSTSSFFTGPETAPTTERFATEGAVLQADGAGCFFNKPYLATDSREFRSFSAVGTTCSTNIQFKFHSDTTVAGHVRIMVDGKEFVTNSVIPVAANQDNFIFIGQWTDGERLRNIKVQCDGAVHIGAITVCNSNQWYAPPNYDIKQKRLFVLGDSMVANYGLDGHFEWHALEVLAHSLGMPLYRRGYGATGFSSGGSKNFGATLIREIADEGLARDGDVFWFYGGGSDASPVGSLNSSQITTNIWAATDYIRNTMRCTHSPIVFQPGLWFHNYTDSGTDYYPVFSTGASNAVLLRPNTYFFNTKWFNINDAARILAVSDQHFNKFGQMEGALNITREVKSLTDKTR